VNGIVATAERLLDLRQQQWLSMRECTSSGRSKGQEVHCATERGHVVGTCPVHELPSRPRRSFRGLVLDARTIGGLRNFVRSTVRGKAEPNDTLTRPAGPCFFSFFLGSCAVRMRDTTVVPSKVSKAEGPRTGPEQRWCGDRIGSGVRDPSMHPHGPTARLWRSKQRLSLSLRSKRKFSRDLLCGLLALAARSTVPIGKAPGSGDRLHRHIVHACVRRD
jgi:hypothetical protein